ncbi:MAG: hypothetical protein ACK56F_11210, partial [bacterium]
NSTEYGISLGDGDLSIIDKSNLTKGSVASIGDSYELPSGIEYDSVESKSYLAGKQEFLTLEIEVFQIL